jgi:hypothetical protein
VPAAELTASQIKATIERMMIRNRYKCHDEELEAIHEAFRRVEQHEVLMGQVVPDLRNQLTELQAKSGAKRGWKPGER